MKIKLIILTIILFSSIENFAQCVRGISTNPEDPSNPFMEGFMAGLPQPQPQINPWLNTFDWGSTNSVGFNPIPLAPNGGWQVPDYTGTLFTMESPYHAGGSANYSYLAQPVNDFKERDFHWEDGWELLWLAPVIILMGRK